MIKRRLVLKTMQHRSHPPGEALSFSDSLETRSRIPIQSLMIMVPIERDERLGKIKDIGEGEIHALGPCGRNNVRRVSR
jgi:hypothetical protein